MIMQIVDVCQEFRKLIQNYLLTEEELDEYDSEDEYPGQQKNDELLHNIRSRTKKNEEAFTGMGLLKFSSDNFAQTY